jgi:hypothetical protein
MRPAFDLPSDEELRTHIEVYNSGSFDERLERYKFIWQEFGPPRELILGGGILSFPAFLEIRHAYIDGCFLGCVLLVQLFIEHSLGNLYMIWGEDQIAEQGFVRLIDKALEDNAIDAELADRLHTLRLMRNAYVHPKAGLGNRTLLRRTLEGTGLLEEQAHEDAKTAIQILTNYLRRVAHEKGTFERSSFDTE